jgi:integrase
MGENKLKLTKRFLDGLPTPNRLTVYWDTEVPGLHVKITPHSSKSYYVYYRRRMDHKQRRPRLGSCSIISLEQARETARDYLYRVSKGEDPTASQYEEVFVQTSCGRTFGEVCQLYMQRKLFKKALATGKWWNYHEVRRVLGGVIKAGTEHEIVCYTGGKLATLWKLPASAIDGPAMQLLHDSMSGTPGMANKVADIVRAAWNWAARRGFVKGPNPGDAVERFTRNARERILTRDERPRFMDALEGLSRCGGANLLHAQAILLMTFTSARKNEVLGLRWRDVHFDRNCVVFSKTKNKKDRFTPMTPQMLVVLKTIDTKWGEWVFPSPRSASGHVTSIHHFWEKVRAATGIADINIHDLRRTYMSLAQFKADLSRERVAKLVGSNSKVLERHYSVAEDDEVRSDAMRVGDVIEAEFKRDPRAA